MARGTRGETKGFLDADSRLLKETQDGERLPEGKPAKNGTEKRRAVEPGQKYLPEVEDNPCKEAQAAEDEELPGKVGPGATVEEQVGR